MKPTEMLSQIKTLLGAKLNLAQMTLENGTIIEAEAFEAGQPVFIVTEDERVALPVGEYALEDGKKLIVEDEGVIASIAEASAEAEKEEDTQEEQLEDETVEVEAPEEVAEEVTAVVEAVVEAIAPVLEEVKTEVEELKKKFASYEDKKEKMASQKPARKPMKHNPEKKQQKTSVNFAENRSVNMKDRVFNKLFN